MCFSLIRQRLQPLKTLSDRYAMPWALLIARLLVARDFYRSGMIKLDYILNGQSDTLYALFEDEYKVPFLAPKLAAWMATIGENGLSVLLAFGIFARFGALGLIVMSGVVYSTDGNQLAPFWAAICLIVAAHGPGRFSLDALLFRTSAQSV